MDGGRSGEGRLRALSRRLRRCKSEIIKVWCNNGSNCEDGTRVDR